MMLCKHFSLFPIILTYFLRKGVELLGPDSNSDYSLWMCVGPCVRQFLSITSCQPHATIGSRYCCLYVIERCSEKASDQAKAYSQ